MKVELVEETKYNGEPWYIIKIDDLYFKGTGNKIVAEAMYTEIINDPNVIKTRVNILKSQDIDVPLEEPNN